MTNTGKPSCLLARRARKARRKRLAIRQSMDSLTHKIDPPSVGNNNCNRKKIWSSFKEFVSRETQNTDGKEVSGILTSDPSPSASALSEPVNHSSASTELPAGTLVNNSGVCVKEASESLNCLSYGSISVIGRRREMEDALTVDSGMVGGEFSFFGVYDGHGGSSVSNACRAKFHKLLADEIEEIGSGGSVCAHFDWEKMMKSCFKKMDEEVNDSVGGGIERYSAPVSAKMIGSTAVVVMVGKEEVVVANCGDSRAVLCRGGVAVPLSHDHKPDRPDERERVEAAGGKIINWNGSRILGVLATSRSIGDGYLKPYVISEPEVTVSKRTVSDDFLIIASDGLWDVVSNEIACEVVRACLNGQIRKKFTEGTCVAEAVAMLAELALVRGSRDNISVIVVELKKSSNGVS